MQSPPDSPAVERFESRRFLIASGTSDYQLLGDDDQLPLGHGEVQRILGLFTQLGYEQVLPELASNPGADQLRRGLSRWCKDPDRRADDILVVYYSGHGAIDEDGQHYLLTADSEWDDLVGSAFPAEVIARALVGSPLREVLVILDTCWAGSGVADLERVAAQLAQRRKAGEQVGGGLWFVAAARAKDRAEPSVFVESLCRVVEMADPGHLQQFLDPHRVIAAVNDELAARRRWQRASCSVSDNSRLPRFLPNRHYDPHAPPNVDVETQRIASQTRRRQEQDARYRQDVLEHFGPRSRGVEFEAEPGWYFTGRREVLQELVRWIEAPDFDRRARVVTGEPGSGKSAVLARLVTLADPKYRERIPAGDVPPETIPPPGSIDVAIHARQRRLEDVVAAIATCADIEAEDADGLLARLAEKRLQLVVVIDALDEAGGGTSDDVREPRRIARKLLRPLSALPGIRLLVGTRRPLLNALGPDKIVLDLDSPTYIERADLAEYARRLLLADGDPERATPYRSEPALARTVANGIADRAYPCFLVARIVARTLAGAPTPVDTQNPKWREFPEEVGEAFDDYLERFGDNEQRIRRLLAPLVYAEGGGLPRDELWSGIASALSGVDCTDDDISWLLSHAAAYIVEATEQDRSVYRLYHQALVDHLRDKGRDTELQRRISQSLIDRVPMLLDSPDRDWFAAHQYIRAHLATHAAYAGNLDDLLLDPLFVLASEPRRLQRAARVAATPVAVATREVHQLAGQALQVGTLSDRMAHLQLAACRSRAADLEQLIMSRFLLPWWGQWAHWRGTGNRRIAVEQGFLNCLGTAELEGRRVVVTSSSSGRLRAWELESGQPTGEPWQLKDPLTAMAVAELDGRPVVITATNHTVQVKELDTGRPVHKLWSAQVGRVKAVTVASVYGRSTVVIGGANGTARAWDLESWEPVGTPWEDVSPAFGTEYMTNAVAVAELDGRQLAVTVGNDRSVRVWDLASGKSVGRPWLGHEGSVYAVTLAELDGRQVVLTGGRDRCVRVWDLESGEPIGRPWRGHDGAIKAMVVAELDGRQVVVTAGDDCSVRMWDLESGEPIGKPWRVHDGAIKAMVLTELDERPVVVTSGADPILGVCELELTGSEGEPWHGHEGPVNAVILADGYGQPVVVSCGADGTIRRWELESGQPVGEPLRGHEGWVNSIAVTERHGHPVIVSGGADGTVRMWELESGRPVGEPLRGHEGWVNSIAVTERYGHPVIVSGGNDHAVRMWDVETGQPLGKPWKSHRGRINAVVAAQLDGVPIAVTASNDRTVRIWDLEAGRPAGNPVSVAMGWATAVTVGERHSRPVIVSGGADGTVRMWELESGRPVGEPLRGHHGWVTTVAIAEMDRRPLAVIAGDDRGLRIWNLGATAVRTVDMGGAINCVTATPGGPILVGSRFGLLVLRLNPDL